MKRLALIILIPILVMSAKADNLTAMTAKFRVRAMEKDSTTSLATDADIKVFINHAQARIAKIGGYLPKRTDIAYVDEQLIYTLPVTFKYLDDKNGGMLRSSDDWIPMLYNPGLRIDTTAPSYTVAFISGDTAQLYLSGTGYVDSDTIRVHYFGAATNLDSGSQECDFPNDMEVFVIDEAVLLYEQAKRAFEAYSLLYQSQRQDMGIDKQVRK